MVKPRLGLAGGVLFKANCQGVPIHSHVLGALVKEHNIGMKETRAARVEQNTKQKAEPSTLYQVYRCINNIRDIVISQHKHNPTWSNLHLHLQLATL